MQNYVSIHNTVNSSSVQSSASSVHTKIRIETNGQVKTYESDKPGTVHLQSDDGNSQVTVKSNIIKEKPKVEVKKTLWNEIISFFQRIFR